MSIFGEDDRDLTALLLFGRRCYPLRRARDGEDAAGEGGGESNKRNVLACRRIRTNPKVSFFIIFPGECYRCIFVSASMFPSSNSPLFCPKLWHVSRGNVTVAKGRKCMYWLVVACNLVDCPASSTIMATCCRYFPRTAPGSTSRTTCTTLSTAAAGDAHRYFALDRRFVG